MNHGRRMTDTPAAAPPRLSTTDRIYGAVGAIAIVLAAFFLVRGGSGDTGAAASRAPLLTIEDPRPGATLDQPVTLLFDARTDLGTDGTDAKAARHVHVDANGMMLMPGPGDVRRVEGGRYRWTLPRLPAGPATLVVYWSDARHRPVAGATSDSVRVTLR
jgi:hypothetical protein